MFFDIGTFFVFILIGSSSYPVAARIACSSRSGVCVDGENDIEALIQNKVHVNQVPLLGMKEATCGFSTECALDYTMASVKEAVAQSYASQDANREALQKMHDKQRQACMASADRSSKILEDGGWCYDKQKSHRVQAREGKVDQDFFLPPHHVVADEVLVSVLAEKVLLREDGSCCHSLTDLGAGIGQFGHALRARLPQLEYHGYDGGGNVEEFTNNYVKFADLTLPLSLKPTDWVISSEVGEHIPHKYEAQVIANIHAHNCRGVILTWAVVGQGGNGHINCHSNSYLIKIFEDLGYKINEELTSALRASRSRKNHPWLMHSSMAFERTTKLTTCDSGAGDSLLGVHPTPVGHAENLMSWAYYINMDRSTARKQYMEDQLLKLQRASEPKYGRFLFQRFRAVDGKLDPWVQHVLQQKQEGNLALTQAVRDLKEEELPGTLACYRSHLLAWKRALRDVQSHVHHDRFVMILEDDAKFMVESLEGLPSRLESVPKDADMVMLGSFGLKRQRDYVGSGVYLASGPFGIASDEDAAASLKAKNSSSVLERNHPYIFYGGTHAYLIRSDRLQALINFIETRPPSYEFDRATASETHDLKKYVLDPPMVNQNRDFSSDISSLTGLV